MDRETARDMIRDRADIKRETARYPDTELNRYINTGNKKLHRLYQQHGLVRDEALYTITADGSASYNLPALHFKTLQVWHNNGSRYPRPLSMHTFMDRPHAAPVAQNGHALSYRVSRTGSQRTIELWPRPAGGTYYVAYLPRIADLAADSDELVAFDDDHAEHIILWASIQCLRKEGSKTADLERDMAMVEDEILEDALTQEEGNTHAIRDVRWENQTLWDELWPRYFDSLGNSY